MIYNVSNTIDNSYPLDENPAACTQSNQAIDQKSELGKKLLEQGSHSTQRTSEKLGKLKTTNTSVLFNRCKAFVDFFSISVPEHFCRFEKATAKNLK